MSNKIPGQQPFNVKPRHGVKRTRRGGAEDCDYVREIMRKSQRERLLVAGRLGK